MKSNFSRPMYYEIPQLNLIYVIVQKQKEWIYNFYFTKKICNYKGWLKNCGQRRTNFFFRKGGFSQKRLRF